MGDTTVTISLNDSEGMEAMLRGYQHGDPLREVFTFTHPGQFTYGSSRADLIGLLEEVFDLGNVLDGECFSEYRLHAEAKRYRLGGTRSISTGDVITIATPDGFTQVFAVEGEGWARIQAGRKAGKL